jgi:hypothetical protein
VGQWRVRVLTLSKRQATDRYYRIITEQPFYSYIRYIYECFMQKIMGIHLNTHELSWAHPCLYVGMTILPIDTGNPRVLCPHRQGMDIFLYPWVLSIPYTFSHG